MSRKKRLLFVGESSFLSTGFSGLYDSLLRALYATGKYEIAEFGSYGHANDPRRLTRPWKQYFATPETPEEAAEYGKPSNHPDDMGQLTNQFGAYKFDKVSLDFRQDFTILIRDNWMDTWALRSPYRHNHKILWMACIDSIPQKENWVRDYEMCNYVMGYSDFGIDTLARSSPRLGQPRSKLHRIPPRTPIDTDIFRPMDKVALKKEWLEVKSNIPVIMGNQIGHYKTEDRKIILSTMRNQARKLFPDTIDSFCKFKLKYKGNEAVDNAILWLHTSYPDNASSYDYPRHIARLSHGYHGVLMHYPDLWKFIYNTYICEQCGNIFAGHAILLHGKPIENRTGQPGAGRIYVPCPKCGRSSATCPTTAGGVSRDVLAQIYNCADLYVQLAIAEGDCLPIIESKCCGVPVLGLDYSAISEKVRIPTEYAHIDKENYTEHLGGMPVKVDRWYYEPETSQRRALPDIEDCATKMFELITNDELRLKMGEEARRGALLNHKISDVAARWEYILDNINAKPLEETWDAPVTLRMPNKPTPPKGINAEQFIAWCYTNILGDAVDNEGMKNWLDSLKRGNTPEQIYQYFINESLQRYEIGKAMKDSQEKFYGRVDEEKNTIGAIIVD